MKAHPGRLLVVIGIVVTACASGPAAVPIETDVERAPVEADAPVAELAAGFNDAGFELWSTQPSEANFVFSPASIGHTLLMARGAADEATGSAIDDALALPDGISAHQAWNAADWEMASDANELTLRLADRIWPDTTTTPNQEWVDLLASQHGATTETLDLRTDPSGSRQVINDWVGDQTEGLIPELLPDGFIHSQTVLVLTDAVYFEADWARPFGKYSDESGPFTRLDGTSVETEFMHELEGGLHGLGDGFAAVELPYADEAFSMLVVVPDEGRFEEVRERMGQDLLDEIDASLEAGPYELFLPRWETTSQLDLLDWLSSIGAAPGSYPGISPDAFLDAAVHAADIAVDEWGTVAAAATAFGFEESGPPEPELTVRADRPYLYLIRHRPTGLVLFAGQVSDPTA